MIMATEKKALTKPTMEQVGVITMVSRTTLMVTKITKKETISEMEITKIMEVQRRGL